MARAFKCDLCGTFFDAHEVKRIDFDKATVRKGLYEYNIGVRNVYSGVFINQYNGEICDECAEAIMKTIEERKAVAKE